MKRRPVFLLVMCIGLSIAPTYGRQKPSTRPAPTTDDASVTTASVTIDGRQVRYRATAGTMPIEKEDGTVRGGMFYVAYQRLDVPDLLDRPVAFAFNGGPGAASVWLHLGALGPRRLSLRREGFAPPPPYRLVDNEYSLLDVTDLVFIDPVGTGFSRPAPGASGDGFFGVEEDIEAVAQFIHLYVTRNQRWLSPKFLIGESYGTTRAAGLVAHLQKRHGMYFNGVVLVSTVLNFQTISFDPGNDLPYVMVLPSYTAAAWYHRRLPESLQRRDLPDVLAEAERFAVEQYAPALIRGATLDPARREAVVNTLSRLTGLSRRYISRSDLRVPVWRFAKELLRDANRTVGRFDSRFTGIDRTAVGEAFEYDPSYDAIQGVFSSTMHHYVRAELRYESDLLYEILAPQHVQPWDYGRYENRYLDLTDRLRDAMTKNPYLKLFVASGYYDLATPYFATDYTIWHLGLDPSLADNVTIRYYFAGHMMYLREPSLANLSEDLEPFKQEAKGASSVITATVPGAD